MIASYYTYYVVRPEGRELRHADHEGAHCDVGTLGTPVAPAADRDRQRRGGGRAIPRRRARGLASLHGRWVMLVVAPGACDAGCRQRLYEIRQVRLTTGKDRDRVERA